MKDPINDFPSPVRTYLAVGGNTYPAPRSMMTDKDWWDLDITIPFIPPTSNHIYVTQRNSKKRFLSKEAYKFVNDYKQLVVSTYLPIIGRLDSTGLFEIWNVCYFPVEDLLNKSFGSGEKSAAKTRYKRMDADNRVKLINDCLSKALGVTGDEQFFDERVTKMNAGASAPFVLTRVRQAPPQLYGI